MNQQQTDAVLRGIFEGAPYLIAVEDTSAHYLAFNSAYHAEFKKVFGVDLVIGASMIESLAHLPKEQEAVTQLFERTMNGEDFIVTQEFGDERLRRGYYEIHCFPLRDSEGQLLGGTHISRDVTDLRRAEEALRTSEENYRRIIDSSPDCIKVLDLEGHVLSINPGGQRMMEIEDLDQYLGDLWLDYWQDEDRQLAAAALDRARSGEVGHFCARGTSLKNNTRWWDETVSPILDAGGWPERLLVIARDITEQKKAEDELRRSEEEFRSFFESSSGGKVQADPATGRFLRVNGKMCELTGYTPAELLGMTFADVSHPEDRELQLERYCQARDGQAAEHVVEERYLRKDGVVIWVQSTIGFLRDESGKAYHALAVIQDITPLKRIEQELRASEERLVAFMRHLPIAAWMKDLAGRYVYVNSEAERIFSKTLADLQGRTDEEIFPPETARQFLQNDIHALTDGSIIKTAEVLRQDDGIEHLSIVNKFPIAGVDGLPAYIGGTAFDITERKQTEEALRASEERLRLAQHAGHVGVFDWDITTDHAVITSELEEIFGLAPGAEEGTYENWIRHVHPDDLDRISEASQRCFRERRSQADFEYRIIGPDGQVRWVDVKGQITYLDTGQPIRMIGTIMDITERKMGEEALRESEGKFRALAENARACFGIVQGQRFVYANPWFAQVSGYSVAEILTMDFPQLTHPDFRPLMAERARRRQMGESVPNHYEFAMLTKSGEKRWVEFSVGTIAYQGQPAIIGAGFDITERKRAEERLTLLSEAAAHLLKAENPDTMILELFEKVSRHLDLQGYMNFMVNEAGDALRLDSYAGVPEAAARQVARLEFGQGVCGTVAQCRRAIHAFEIQQSDEEMVQLIKQLGIRAYACNPLMPGGRLLGTLAFATSNRDRFSEDELEFMRTICHYVALAKERLRLEGELRTHIESLAEADRRKDEFLAMMAHELRNPLAPIRNAAQVLRLAAPQEATLQRQRDIIDRQVTHMARLLDDLLDVSRITRGNVNLKKQTVKLSEVFARAVESANPLIESRRHTLTVTPPADGLQVFGDFDRLIQIVSNLLSNAAKYTEEGGTIWLEAAVEGPEVVIRVRDTGVGIAPEMLPRVFDVFTQVTRTLDRSQGGLGLGLTLVRNLTQMHGGRVEARSAGLGQGSEFIVRLPALKEDHAAGQRGAEWSPAQAKTTLHRILVVDDVVDTADSLAELLSLLGHEVRTAYDGPAGIRAAQEFQPDVILLDIGLPGENGYEVARQIRYDANMKSVMLVAVTGYGQEEDRRLARQAGFDHLFTKPVDLGALQSLLT